jgi:hypothetical protein
MTLNSRHARPKPEDLPLYGRRTETVRALARIPRTNVTLPAALGRLITLITLIPLIPQSLRQTNALGFTKLGGITAHNALNAHPPQRKTGDLRRLKPQRAPSLHPGSTEMEEKRGHNLGR